MKITGGEHEIDNPPATACHLQPKRLRQSLLAQIRRTAAFDENFYLRRFRRFHPSLHRSRQRLVRQVRHEIREYFYPRQRPQSLGARRRRSPVHLLRFRRIDTRPGRGDRRQDHRLATGEAALCLGDAKRNPPAGGSQGQSFGHRPRRRLERPAVARRREEIGAAC